MSKNINRIKMNKLFRMSYSNIFCIKYGIVGVCENRYSANHLKGIEIIFGEEVVLQS